jgi:hypothetical protein
MITFEKGQRKDEIANQRRAAFAQAEGVVFWAKRKRSALYIAPRNGTTLKPVRPTPGS